MASLFDAVERPRVIINTNDFDKPKSLADAIEREPEAVDGIPEHHKSILQSTVDKLFGLHGEERYQLWPERLVREAVSAPHDVMTEGLLPPGLRREDFTDIPASTEPTTAVGKVLGLAPVGWQPNDNAIEKAQAVSALAGTGGLAGAPLDNISRVGTNLRILGKKIGNQITEGAGSEAGMALGSGPLKPKFDFSIGESSGSRSVKIGPTEITYGVNPKNNDVELSLIRTDKDKRGQGAGRAAIEQFLNEADANNKRVLLNADPMDKSTSKNKLVDFYKSLGFLRNKGSNKDFTTRAEFIRNPFLKSDSEAGLGVGALNATNKPFYSAVENAVAAAKQPKADAQQWLSFLKNQPGVKQEELAHLGLDKLSGSITKDDLLKAVQEGQPQINEVIKGKTSVITKSNPEEPHILEVYHPDDPNGEINGMFGEIVKDKNKFTVNVPEIPRKSFNTQKEAEDFISANSNLGSNTKYHSYQLPGGENYREMLLTLPVQGGTNKRVRIYNSDGLSSVKVATPEELERLRSTGRIKFDELEDVNPQTSYTSSHWDEPNVLAHIRMNDRNIDGKKSLHLEEIQSDWHQEGRKKGYKGESKNSRNLDDIQKDLAKAHEDLVNNPNAETKASYDKFMEERRLALGEGLVPDAPFKKTWDELALKKAITHAVKNGYDSISWTPGEAQAARYDLSKQVDAIRANKNPDGTYMIGTQKPGHNMARPTKEMEAVPADKLADIVGKELAEKIIKGEGGKADEYGRVYSGLDLKVGGQGMKAFYDKMLVDKMNKLISKYDSKVKMVDHNSMKLPTVEITPKLKEKVLKEGFPLFSSGLPIFTPVDHDPFENK